MGNFFGFSVNKKENTPIFSEAKSDWVPYGEDNQYPTYLIDLMNKSSKHNSLIKKKVNMTVGGGFVESELTKNFIDNPNGREDLNTIVYKNGYDLNTYGGFSFAGTWNNDRTAVSRLTYIDHSKVRIAKKGIFEDGDPRKLMQEKDHVPFYFTSSDWSQYRKQAHRPKLWQGFSEKHKDTAVQIVSVNEYRAGVDFYTYPDYIASVDWIELDREIANFHLSSVHNGFTPSMVISFKGGVPTDEEQKTLKKKLQKQYGGADNASQVFVTFSESADSSPEFIPINLNASDERFLQLEEQIQQNIIVGHGASPILAGVAVGGKLGSSDEVLENEQMFQRNVIDAKQKIIERAYNKICDINGYTEKLELIGIKSFDEKNIEDGDK